MLDGNWCFSQGKRPLTTRVYGLFMMRFWGYLEAERSARKPAARAQRVKSIKHIFYTFKWLSVASDFT